MIRLRGHLRTNLTLVKALETYAAGVADAGGSLIVCGLQPATITQLRSAGLPETMHLIPQGEETDGALAEAHQVAMRWLATTPAPDPPEPGAPDPTHLTAPLHRG